MSPDKNKDTIVVVLKTKYTITKMSMFVHSTFIFKTFKSLCMVLLLLLQHSIFFYSHIKAVWTRNAIKIIYVKIFDDVEKVCAFFSHFITIQYFDLYRWTFLVNTKYGFFSFVKHMSTRSWVYAAYIRSQIKCGLYKCNMKPLGNNYIALFHKDSQLKIAKMLRSSAQCCISCLTK